jgi:hypothetical protein
VNDPATHVFATVAVALAGVSRADDLACDVTGGPWVVRLQRRAATPRTVHRTTDRADALAVLARLRAAGKNAEIIATGAPTL